MLSPAARRRRGLVDPTTVHTITLTIPDAGVDALRADPSTNGQSWVSWLDCSFCSSLRWFVTAVRVFARKSRSEAHRDDLRKVAANAKIGGLRRGDLRGLE